MSEPLKFTGYKQMMQARDAKLAKEQQQNQHENAPENSESPKDVKLDVQFEEVGRPTREKLDVRTSKDLNLGRPKNSIWTQYEKHRSSVKVTLRLDPEIDRRVRKYCAAQNPAIDLKDFYEQAAHKHLEFLDVQENENLDVRTSLNNRELIMWKTTPPIINLYCKFNPSKKRSVKDDLAAQKFNNADPRIVELGILQTLGNKNFNAKVNSFAYFVPEIEVWIENNLPSESVEVILEMNRRKWEAFNAKK